jgi:excisionase family DNA binding protein
VEKLAYTYEEAAQALAVSKSTIKRQVGLGKLDVVSIGRARRIPVAPINRLIDTSTQSLNDQQGRTA